jgi:CheY-like chemotaxis protein
MVHQHIILLTDRDIDVSVMMEEVLLGEGYAVRRCSGAPDTIDVVEAALPDMVIVDLLRGGAGETIAFLERLRLCPVTRDVAALATSTDARLLRDLSEPLRELGCDTLIKPFELDDFLALVAQCTCRHRMRGADCDGARP